MWLAGKKKKIREDSKESRKARYDRRKRGKRGKGGFKADTYYKDVGEYEQ